MVSRYSGYTDDFPFIFWVIGHPNKKKKEKERMKKSFG